MPRVYVSSTRADLGKHLQVAREVLRHSELIDVCMEHRGADVRPPINTCLEDVRSSDLYVGIFAWRYGSCPPDEERSFTELEYREAEARGIPRLIFLVDRSVEWPPGSIDAVTKEGNSGRKIEALRSELEESHTVSYFSTPESLGLVLAQSIESWRLSKMPRLEAIGPDATGRETYLEGILEKTQSTRSLPALRARTVVTDEPLNETTPHEFFRAIEQHSDVVNAEVLLDDRVLAIKQRGVFLGEPGAGKSTVLKRLANHFATNALEDPNALVPLAVNLAEWPDSISDFRTLLIHEREVVSAPRLPLERFALLVDGLNEMDAARYDERIAAINAWLKKNKSARIYFASRPHHYFRAEILPIEAINILPLSPDDVERIIDHELQGESALRFREAIRALGLDEKDAVQNRSLVQNPYVLNLAIFIYRNDKQGLPHTLGAMFDRFTVVAVGRELARYSQSDLDSVLELLESTASAVIRERHSTSIAAKWVEQSLDIDAAKCQLLQSVGASLGVLLHDDNKKPRFCFVHHLLLEYFAARGARSDPRQLLSLLRQMNTRTRTDVPFDVSRLVDMMRDVEISPETLREASRIDPYFVADVVVNKGQPAPSWLISDLISCFHSDNPSLIDQAFNWLVRIGDDCVPALLDVGLRDEGIASKAAVRALGAIGTDLCMASVAEIATEGRYRWARRQAIKELSIWLSTIQGSLQSSVQPVLLEVGNRGKWDSAVALLSTVLANDLLPLSDINAVAVQAGFDAELLSKIERTPEPEMEDNSSSSDVAWLTGLDAHATSKVLTLLNQLAELPSWQFVHKRNISIQIARFGRQAIPVLLGCLESRDEVLRRRTCRIMGAIQDPAVSAALVERYESEQSKVRGEMLVTLVRHHHPSSREFFSALLEGDSDEPAAWACVGLACLQMEGIDQRVYEFAQHLSSRIRALAALASLHIDTSLSASVRERLRQDKSRTVHAVASSTRPALEKGLSIITFKRNFITVK